MGRYIKYNYTIEKSGGLTMASAALMSLAIILRLVWAIGWPEHLRGLDLWALTVLPVAAGALLLIAIFRYGHRTPMPTAVPVLMGVIFFLIKAVAGFQWWHAALCTLLYLTVAALYGLTVLGVLPTHRLLIPLFSLPLLFHIFVEDLFIMRTVYTLPDWIGEGSVLCIMGSLLCLSLGMKKQRMQ